MITSQHEFIASRRTLKFFFFLLGAASRRRIVRGEGGALRAAGNHWGFLHKPRRCRGWRRGGAQHFQPVSRRGDTKPLGRSEVSESWLLGFWAGPTCPRCSPAWHPAAPSVLSWSMLSQGSQPAQCELNSAQFTTSEPQFIDSELLLPQIPRQWNVSTHGWTNWQENKYSLLHVHVEVWFSFRRTHSCKQI